MSKSLALTALFIITFVYTGSVHAQANRPEVLRTPPQRAVTYGQAEQEMDEINEVEEVDSTVPTAERPRPLPMQRTQQAQERMSVVAQEVQRLLIEEDREGGVGGQVRVVAREQQQLSVQARERVQEIAQRQMQAQTRVQEQLEKMDQRRDFVRSLIGPHFGAMKEMRAQIQDNQAQIEELLALSEQEKDADAKAELTAFAQALVAQNEALAEKVQAEEQAGRGVFGWFFRWMNR